MKLYLLYYGVTYVDKGVVLTKGIGIGEIIPTPIWGALIYTGKEWVLIDTGMNPVHMEDPDATFRGTDLSGKIKPVLSREDLANSRVRSCGVNPEDIRYVINTHLHFDHCGGNRFFKGSEFVVQKEHYDWAMSGNCPRRDFDLPAIKWNLLEGECEFLPGIRLILTPGHVPGHQSVCVDLDGGTVIITGDAISLRENMNDDAPVIADDAVEFHNSVHKLLAYERACGGKLLLSHDQSEWEQWPHAPNEFLFSGGSPQ